ncbi:RNA polymerase sigma factor (plasmid) [Streptomyces sp. DSM 116496]|uniref:RNA polymerase sigma factor n=1 Tax=Streptomyces stoeckheimensis TaxID=3344656 RepID=UPI0038B23A4F
MVNGSPRRVLDAEDIRRVQGPGGRTLFETYVTKVVTDLGHTFGSQISDTDCQAIAAGAFVTAFHKGIDPDGNPVAYIKQIAFNDALEFLDKRKNEVTTDLLDLFGDAPAEDANPDAATNDEPVGRRKKEDCEVWDQVDAEILKIPAPQAREVTRLQSLGNTDEMIADNLGIPKNQIYQQRHRTTLRLRTQLRQYIRPGGGPPASTEPGEQ